ncbi:hypothetical protein IE53DRAFT_260403 [Violaceomyces palustris]|uniref:Uncharacterized protein n=1 Tax=Violaceomyces palustris TaxID=1673888 RepID=A0ACD0P3N7_9BASI|nr:hypothetical protein IE53DRAFT_260403 [Violaceomyces palustris]
MFRTTLLTGLVAIVIGLASTQDASSACTQPANIVPGKNFDRVFTIFFENEDRANVLKDPNFKKATQMGIDQSSYYATTHPSQPNYIAYVSGSTQGVTNDSNANLNGKSIVDLLEPKGISWGAYAEALPSSNYTGSKSGTYYRKHEPFISFNNIRNSASRVNKIKNADALDADIKAGNLPQFVFFAPDINNDGHDTSIDYAGNWLSGFLSKYNDHFQNTNTVLHLTFDESETYTGPNLVYSTISGGSVDPSLVGTTDNTGYTHYSMLKTVENNWGLGSLQTNDANATPFAGLKRNPNLCG